MTIVLAPFYRRTRVALRVARALLGKGHIHDGVAIRGADTFVRATVAALDLLQTNAPDVYALMRRHTGDIVAGTPSGVFASLLGWGPTVILMGPSFSEGPVIEYAGALAHEAYHCELYQSAKQANPNSRVQKNVYSGEYAERLCLHYQCEVLRRLGLDATRIGEYETALKTRWWDVPVDQRNW